MGLFIALGLPLLTLPVVILIGRAYWRWRVMRDLRRYSDDPRRGFEVRA